MKSRSYDKGMESCFVNSSQVKSSQTQRKKSAKERHEQRRRAEGRVVQSLLRAVVCIKTHRGGQYSKLAIALSDALHVKNDDDDSGQNVRVGDKDANGDGYPVDDGLIDSDSSRSKVAKEPAKGATEAKVAEEGSPGGPGGQGG